MTRNIILLSDGTGNSASKVWRTNVWRLFQALDLTTPTNPNLPIQVAVYDDGVGTSAFKPLAILGGVFGWGLKRNVLELYKFLCRNYHPGSQIYGFGFSRGAFTMRVVMGLVAHQGIVSFSSEGELHRNAKAAYRAYRTDRYQSNWGIERIFRVIRDAIVAIKNLLRGNAAYMKAESIPITDIRFIGVWDTVAAYGLPIDEMTRGVDQYLWPLRLPDRVLSNKVKRACHAVALDDERTTFHPMLWNEEGHTLPQQRSDGTRNIRDERLSQVWFVGSHSNVGGGYPDDSLAQIPLYWMMQEAEACGLRFKNPPNLDPDCMLEIKSARDKDGRLYDSRAGFGGYYRYGPRKIPDLCSDRDQGVSIVVPKIHHSALERIVNGAHIYAPIGFPSRYQVVMDDGSLIDHSANSSENEQRASARAATQESVWDQVWQRRVVYFATLASTFYLALFPLFYQTDRSDEFSTNIRLVSEALRLVDAFVPNFFNWWINSYAANPWKFLLGATLVGTFIWTGARIGASMRDRMKALWAPTQPISTHAPGWIFKLRTARWYQKSLRLMRRTVLPFLSAVSIVYFVSAVASHLIFNIQDSAGFYCKESSKPQDVPWLGELTATAQFNTKALCFPTGINLDEGQRYVITIRQTTPWKDKTIDTDVGGFDIMDVPHFSERVTLWLATPLRRVFLRTWFVVIGRIGAVGTDEYFLDHDKPTSINAPKKEFLEVPIVARRTGEFFIYVNDAVVGVPFYRSIADFFIENNEGTATVNVRHAPLRR